MIKKNKKLISLVLIVKLFIFLIIILAYNFLPFNKSSYFANFNYPANEKISQVSSFKTWDSQHYLFLSEIGYSNANESDRFFPLYPLSIKIINYILTNLVISGLLISFISSFLAVLVFYYFCKDYFKNEKLAFKTVLLLLSFPTAFYLTLIYSEGLCLMFTMFFFYFLYKKKFFLAAFFSFLLPLTRPIGILIIIPQAVFWITYLLQTHKESIPLFLKNFVTNKKTYYLFSPVLGILVYFIFMQLATGNYLEGVYMLQNSVVGNWSLANVLNPLFFFVNLFFPTPFSLHGFTNSLIDRIFFVSYLALLVLIYKKLDKTLFVYALVVGMVPIFGNFMSYTRYILLVFPIFMVLSKLFNKPKYRFFFYPTTFLFIIIQVIFLIMHALNYWVA